MRNIHRYYCMGYAGGEAPVGYGGADRPTGTVLTGGSAWAHA